MEKRRITKEKYIVAGIITIGVFILGLLLGLVIEGQRTNYLNEMIKEHQVNYNSVQLQYIYIDQMASEGNCPGVMQTLNKNIEELEKMRNFPILEFHKEGFYVLQASNL